MSVNYVNAGLSHSCLRNFWQHCYVDFWLCKSYSNVVGKSPSGGEKRRKRIVMGYDWLKIFYKVS